MAALLFLGLGACSATSPQNPKSPDPETQSAIALEDEDPDVSAVKTTLRDAGGALVFVRELCDAAEVSEATFFNYFKKKDDLLRYFIQIWTLEVQIVAEQRAGADGGVFYIESIFAHTAERIADNPRVMLEIVGHMALHGEEEEDCEPPALTFAERVQAFPELADAAVSADECQLDAMFRAAITRAIAKKELPAGVNVDVAVGTIISFFFGTPLWHTRIDPKDVGALYAAQLSTLWEGLRCTNA